MHVPTRARLCGASRLGFTILDRPRLSVLLVNYQRWDDTARLVRQLSHSDAFRCGQAEVVVVDNASSHHPAVDHLRATPGVSLVRWRINRGFAVAVNEAARMARGDYLLLLNPDMTARADFLDNVLDRVDAIVRVRPHAGLVGFRLSHSDGSAQLSTGQFPTLTASLSRLLLPRHIRKYTHPVGNGVQPVDWVTGCCLLARRDCWNDLGGFDPMFFLYYEDVDLCKRAHQRGWSVWYDPGACLVHHRPLHARDVPPHLRLVTRHALLTYAAKHWNRLEWQFLGGVVRAEAVARALAARLRGDFYSTEVFSEMGLLADDMCAGRTATARQRLVSVVREQERRDVVPAVSRRSQPQSSRPVTQLPIEHHTPLPAEHPMAGR